MANIELDGANKKIKVDSGDLTLDVPGDIILDADGADLVFADGGTNILKVTNSSSDVVFQPQVDAKDIIFKQYDGTTVATVEDNGTFNIPTDKLAINGTAVTSTAAELNILDGVTATATELNLIDGVTATTAELNILDGVTSTAAELNILDGVTSTAAELNIVDGSTSATSTTIADADRVVLNDNGTMVQAAVTDLKTYIGGGTLELISTHSCTSGVSSITMDNLFSTTYNVYRVFIRYLRPQTNDTSVRMQMLDTSGVRTNTAYRYAVLRIRDGGEDNYHDDDGTFFALNTGTYNSEQQGGANFDMTIRTFRSATGDQFTFNMDYRSHTARNNNQGSTFIGSGHYNEKNSDHPANGLKFFMDSGNIDRAFISVFGVKGAV